MEFEELTSLPSLFRHQTRQVVLCSHVDDLILAGTKSDLEWTLEELRKMFVLSEGGTFPKPDQSPLEPVRFLKRKHYTSQVKE